MFKKEGWLSRTWQAFWNPNRAREEKEHWHEKFRPYKYRLFAPDESSSSSGVEVEGLVDIVRPSFGGTEVLGGLEPCLDSREAGSGAEEGEERRPRLVARGFRRGRR